MERKSHARILVTRSTGREIPDLLRELYIDQRRTQSEIAVHLGVSRPTIGKWLEEFGIERADRQPLSPVL